MEAEREARAPEILALATGPMKAVREVERMPGHQPLTLGSMEA